MKQVIFLDWSKYKPKLFCRDEELNESLILLGEGSELDYELVDCRCIGPEYGQPCPHNSPDGPQCKKCAPRGVYPCVMCNGSQCLLPKKRNKCAKTDYAIYLTSFGDIVKVGVSKRDRLMQRWLEQGAEFACELKKVRDGLLARKLEKRIGQLKEVKMMVRHSKKHANEPRKDVIEEKIEMISKKFRWINPDSQLYDLTEFYPKIPDKKPVVKDLKGVSGGVRGHLLVLNDEVINLKKLVGWRIKPSQS